MFLSLFSRVLWISQGLKILWQPYFPPQTAAIVGPYGSAAAEPRGRVHLCQLDESTKRIHLMLHISSLFLYLSKQYVLIQSVERAWCIHHHEGLLIKNVTEGRVWTGATYGPSVYFAGGLEVCWSFHLSPLMMKCNINPAQSFISALRGSTLSC